LFRSTLPILRNLISTSLAFLFPSLVATVHAQKYA
jgi:hypothetical protein